MMKLREIRTEKKISMKKLGEIVGVSESAISLYETGKREPDQDTLKRIADYFKVSTDYLLGRETPEVDRSAAMLQNANVLDELPPEALEDIDEFIMYTKQKYSK